MTDVTAVVLNWNQPDYTIRAVGALVDDGVPASRIVVVDNGSDDGSWDRFREALSFCHLVRIEQNLGFARGNNVGARVLPAAAYLFVNSDAFVHLPGSVRALLNALDREETGIVVPRLLNEDLTLQPLALPAPHPGSALVRWSGLSGLVPNRFQPHWGTRWDHATSREIEMAAPGAVLLVRGSLWDALGGFTESSFMYAEEQDLCLRARRRGFAVWFCAEAEFVHVGGASTAWDAAATAERKGSANAALVRAHLSPRRAAITLAVVRAGLAGRLAVRRLTGDRDAAAELAGSLRGYGSPDTGGAEEAPTGAGDVVVLEPEGAAPEGVHG